MPTPKTLLTFSPEAHIVVRYACKLNAMKQGKEDQPLGPYIERTLGQLPEIQKAARACGVKLPKRIPDARGRYERG